MPFDKQFIMQHKIPIIIGGIILVAFLAYSKYKQSAANTAPTPTSLGGFNNGGGSTSSSSDNPTDDAIRLLNAQSNVNQQDAVNQLSNYENEFKFLFSPTEFVQSAVEHISGVNAKYVGGSGTLVGNIAGDTTNLSTSGTDNTGRVVYQQGRPVNVGPSGIAVQSVAGDSPYLSEALSGLSGPNSLNIATNRYGTSITLPTNNGVDQNVLTNLLQGGTFKTPTSNADLLFQFEQMPLNSAAGLQLLANGQSITAAEQLAAIGAATQVQNTSSQTGEIQGTEFNNAHQKPEGFDAFLNTISQGLNIYKSFVNPVGTVSPNNGGSSGNSNPFDLSHVFGGSKTPTPVKPPVSTPPFSGSGVKVA